MIILTGAKGFIGRNFLNKLDDVVSVDIEDAWDFIHNFKKWDKVSLIIHQGAISSTTESDIRKIHHYNVNFTLYLLEKAIKYGIPVKYASSASIYGNYNNHPNPLNQYAISKLQIDYWVLDNLEKFSFIQGFRYFNVYGNGEEDKGDQASPISKFTKQVKESGKLRLFENSNKFLRDFVCVDDVVDIVLTNNRPSGVYDLGTSKPVSFQHVAKYVIKKYGGEIEYIPFPEILVGKYQDYTCAKNEWPEHKFISVEEYLS